LECARAFAAASIRARAPCALLRSPAGLCRPVVPHDVMTGNVADSPRGRISHRRIADGTIGHRHVQPASRSRSSTAAVRNRLLPSAFYSRLIENTARGCMATQTLTLQEFRRGLFFSLFVYCHPHTTRSPTPANAAKWGRDCCRVRGFKLLPRISQRCRCCRPTVRCADGGWRRAFDKPSTRHTTRKRIGAVPVHRHVSGHTATGWRPTCLRASGAESRPAGPRRAAFAIHHHEYVSIAHDRAGLWHAKHDAFLPAQTIPSRNIVNNIAGCGA